MFPQRADRLSIIQLLFFSASKDLKTSRGLYDEMKKAASSNVKQVTAAKPGSVAQP